MIVILKKTYLVLFLSLFLFQNSIASRQKLDPISFGSYKLAEDRLSIGVDSFKLKISGELHIAGRIVENTIQWIRLNRSLLIPRALMEVSFQSKKSAEYSWQYGSQKIIPTFDSKSHTYNARVFVSLFESFPLELFYQGKKINNVRIIPNTLQGTHLIDYSCAPFELQVTGLPKDLISVGCELQRTGDFGDERPYLEVLFTSPSYRLKDQSEPPYSIIFYESGSSMIILQDYEGNEEVINVRATLPKKLSRLKIAAGLGPYGLETKDQDTPKDYQVIPTVMLYGNFYLNQSSSLRFFDSFSKSKTTFHNWGVYFAWDLAEFCDQRCLITSLVGAQGVHYQYSSQKDFQSEVIYPQGFEFIYKHPFGKENYRFSYGMFSSLSGLYDYQNIWIRYGKKYFWELNFIEWQSQSRKASLFGISFGFPLGSFF